MRAERGFAVVAVAWIAMVGCEEIGGLAAVSEELTRRYGAEAVDLEVANVDERTRVEVTIERPELAALSEAELLARGRRVARTVVRRFPLEGSRDSVVVTLRAAEEEGIARSSREWTARFAATEVSGGESP